MEKDFEQAFGEFLDREEHETVEAALFDIVRAAYKAGWVAAGGKLPDPKEK